MDKGTSKKSRLKGWRNSVSTLVKDISFDAINSVQYWRHNLKGNRVEKNYFSGHSKYPPVILLQGFMGTRGVLSPLESYLRDKGQRDIISLDLGFFNVADIRSSALLLREKITALLSKFGSRDGVEKIDIVGHSMGGLIGLHYIKSEGGHRHVNRLIGLGAPFHGTWASLLALVPFGVTKSLWQMMPRSHFLTSLNEPTDESKDVKLISISAKYDAICPPKSCFLPGAENLTIPVGHGGLVIDSRAFEAVLQKLSPQKSPQPESQPRRASGT